MDARDPPSRPDSPRLEDELEADGCALLPGHFDDAQVRALIACHGSRDTWGQVLHAQDLTPIGLLPAWLALDRRLGAVARRWREALGTSLPGEATATAIARPAVAVHLDRLGPGGYRPLRGGLDDDVASSFVLMVLLAEPGRDFTGGELVLTEQRPRQQSRPLVLPLRRGDAAIVATTARPCRSARGWYRARIRHAIAPVRSGERLALVVALRASA